MNIEDYDDGYAWLDSYGKGRRRRQLAWLLKKRSLAIWLGIGAGISLGFILLPRLAGIGG